MIKKIFIYILLSILYLSIYINLNILSYALILIIFIILQFDLFKPKKISEHGLHIEQNENLYLEAFQSSGIYAKLDVNQNIIHANRQFYQTMHTTKTELSKLKFIDFIKSGSTEIFETTKHKQSWEGTKVFTTLDKELIYLNCSFIPILDKKEQLKEILFLATDVTELTLSKTNIKNSLYQDPLTKLPNRLKLFTDKSVIDTNGIATYIIFNIDSFDSINNLYGNVFGDNILILVAKWLEQNLPNKDTKLYKFEADIYVMVCLCELEEIELRNYLTKISALISQEKFLYDEAEIDISLTIGAAQGYTNQLKLAQIAYKDAKIAKKSFSIYDQTSNKEEEYTKNIETSKTLKNALEQDMIIPYFQPIMNIQTGEIEKYESLMRIKDEEGKILLPHEFLNIAKRSKIYPRLSCSLIEKSIDTFLIAPCEFSVNLSFLDITNKATNKFILELLDKTGIGPWIIFELLESEGIENYKEVMNFIEQVKSYGAKIAIDDFGSGYSNFERLVELQVDFIKIDGSLIKNIDQNDDMKIITQTIVNFAKALGVKTVAEYVHSEEVLNQVKALGVDYAQGFYIGKPNENIIHHP